MRSTRRRSALPPRARKAAPPGRAAAALVSVGRMPDGAATFVGRGPELEQLLELLRSAAAGKGGTVFLSGDAGMGKQALLGEVARRAADDAELAATVLLTGRCQREHEGQNPYEPFAEILVALVATGPAEKARRAVVDVLKETAPDWLGMIPVVGAGLGAGVKTALRLREAYGKEENEERERLAQDRAAQFLGALETRLERGPVVLAIAQAQWIDGPSAGLLERVSRFAADHAVTVVVLSRPDDVGPDQRLHAVEDELVIDDLATHIDLAGLDTASVADFVQALRGRGVAPEVAAWLREFTDGNPMFVNHLLPVLEESGILVERERRLRLRRRRERGRPRPLARRPPRRHHPAAERHPRGRTPARGARGRGPRAAGDRGRRGPSFPQLDPRPGGRGRGARAPAHARRGREAARLDPRAARRAAASLRLRVHAPSPAAADVRGAQRAGAGRVPLRGRRGARRRRSARTRRGRCCWTSRGTSRRAAIPAPRRGICYLQPSRRCWTAPRRRRSPCAGEASRSRGRPTTRSSTARAPSSSTCSSPRATCPGRARPTWRRCWRRARPPPPGSGTTSCVRGCCTQRGTCSSGSVT